MYGISSLAFDADYDLLDAAPEVQAAQDDRYRTVSALVVIFEVLLNRFVALDHNKLSSENFDQFEIFLVFLQSIAHHNHIGDLLKRTFPSGKVPVMSGPSAVVPSYTHSCISHSLEEAFAHEEPRDVFAHVEVFNEYLGVDGVFPMDIAILFHGDVVAFIEIDGAFHYSRGDVSNSRILHRVDQLKEYLYRSRYPQVPIYRVAASQGDVKQATLRLKTLIAEEVQHAVKRNSAAASKEIATAKTKSEKTAATKGAAESDSGGGKVVGRRRKAVPKDEEAQTVSTLSTAETVVRPRRARSSKTSAIDVEEPLSKVPKVSAMKAKEDPTLQTISKPKTSRKKTTAPSLEDDASLKVSKLTRKKKVAIVTQEE